MADIKKRGNTYRVRVGNCKKKNRITITFSSEQRALDWIKEHEHLYELNPEIYKAWLKANRVSMRKNNLFHNYIPLGEYIY